MTNTELKKIKAEVEKLRGVLEFDIDKCLANIDSIGLKNVEFDVGVNDKLEKVDTSKPPF